jgi:hypothetical protein
MRTLAHVSGLHVPLRDELRTCGTDVDFVSSGH